MINIDKILLSTTIIEIFYDKNQVYCAYKTGGDLNDFDNFLVHALPTIDFNKIDILTAKRLEKTLYRTLSQCKSQRSAMKELALLLSKIENRFSKKIPAEGKTVSSRKNWQFYDWTSPALLWRSSGVPA